jgi:hypothetical protein
VAANLGVAWVVVRYLLARGPAAEPAPLTAGGLPEAAVNPAPE